MKVITFVLVTVLFILSNLSFVHAEKESWKELNDKALYLFENKQFVEGRSIAKKAITIANLNYKVDHPNVATSFHTYAMLLYYSGVEYEQAEKLLKDAILIREKNFGFFSNEVAESLKILAKIYIDQQQYDDAVTLYNRVVEIEEMKIGRDHPYYATSLEELANIYTKQKNYKEAEILYLKSLAIYEKKYGINDPYFVGSVLSKLIKTYESLDEIKNARQLKKRKERIIVDENELTKIRIKVREYTKEKRYAEAIEAAENALELTKKIYGVDSLSVAVDLKGIAELYKAMHEYSKAKNAYSRALEIWIAERGPRHHGVSAIKKELANLPDQ